MLVLLIAIASGQVVEAPRDLRIPGSYTVRFVKGVPADRGAELFVSQYGGRLGVLLKGKRP